MSVVAYARCLAQFRGIPGGYVGLTAADPQDGAGVSLIYRDLPLGVLVTDLRHGVSVRAQLGTHAVVPYNQRKLGKPQILCFGALLITSSHGFQELLKVHNAKHVDQKAFDVLLVGAK